MSATPKLPDECKRLLDNGWMIVLVKSELSDYTAVAIAPRSEEEIRAIRAVNRALKTIPTNQFTGDFEPSQALTALPEKVFGCAPVPAIPEPCPFCAGSGIVYDGARCPQGCLPGETSEG